MGSLLLSILSRWLARGCASLLMSTLFSWEVYNPSAKPPFLEDQILSLSPAALFRPVRLGRPYQEHKVPAGIARKVIEAPKPTTPPPHDKVEKGGE